MVKADTKEAVETATVEPIIPTATSIEGVPSPAGGIDCTIIGTGFNEKAVVCVNGIDIKSTFVSETEIAAHIAATASPGDYAVVVKQGDYATLPLAIKLVIVPGGGIDAPSPAGASKSPLGNAKSAQTKADK